MDISLLQILHFPLNKIYEMTGMLSYQLIFFLHFGQLERPEITPFSSGNRTIQTLAKLPHSNPNNKTKMKSTYVLKIKIWYLKLHEQCHLSRTELLKQHHVYVCKD